MPLKVGEVNHIDKRLPDQGGSTGKLAARPGAIKGEFWCHHPSWQDALDIELEHFVKAEKLDPKLNSAE